MLMAQKKRGALCSTRLDFSCVMHTVTLLAADECVCSGAGFYTPTEDCSGFYQYLTENDPESGPIQSCAPGTLFNPAKCVCDYPDAFTCPSECSPATLFPVSASCCAIGNY